MTEHPCPNRPSSEPPVSEPALTDPGTSEPAVYESAETEPAMSEPAMSGRTLLEPAPGTVPAGGADAHVALLRGVNVNGVTVRSRPLAATFTGLGFGSVRTVLASGNVVFDGGDRPETELKALIERALSHAFRYDAWIVLTRRSRLRAIVEAFPFEEVADRQPYVLFGSDAVVLDELAGYAVADTAERSAEGGERVVRGDGVLYWDLPRGSSTDTPFAKRTARARYRTTTTTRNLRTLRRLL